MSVAEEAVKLSGGTRIFQKGCRYEGCDYNCQADSSYQCEHNLQSHVSNFHGAFTSIWYGDKKVKILRDMTSKEMECCCGQFSNKNAAVVRRHALKKHKGSKALKTIDSASLDTPDADQGSDASNPIAISSDDEPETRLDGPRSTKSNLSSTHRRTRKTPASANASALPNSSRNSKGAGSCSSKPKDVGPSVVIAKPRPMKSLSSHAPLVPKLPSKEAVDHETSAVVRDSISMSPIASSLPKDNGAGPVARQSRARMSNQLDSRSHSFSGPANTSLPAERSNVSQDHTLTGGKRSAPPADAKRKRRKVEGKYVGSPKLDSVAERITKRKKSPTSSSRHHVSSSSSQRLSSSSGFLVPMGYVQPYPVFFLGALPTRMGASASDGSARAFPLLDVPREPMLPERHVSPPSREEFTFAAPLPATSTREASSVSDISSATQQSVQASAGTTCASCKAPLPPHTKGERSFKWCPKCRQKARERALRKTPGLPELQEWMDRWRERRTEPGAASGTRTSANAVAPTQQLLEDGPEYQTEAELFKALKESIEKSEKSGKVMEFRGWFCTVRNPRHMLNARLAKMKESVANVGIRYQVGAGLEDFKEKRNNKIIKVLCQHACACGKRPAGPPVQGRRRGQCGGMMEVTVAIAEPAIKDGGIEGEKVTVKVSHTADP